VQGIDTNSEEAQLIYACAGLAVPDIDAQRAKMQATMSADQNAMFPGIMTSSADEPWIESTEAAGVVMPSQLRVTPGESLNSVNPISADPFVTLDTVKNLTSRRSAKLKIWWVNRRAFLYYTGSAAAAAEQRQGHEPHAARGGLWVASCMQCCLHRGSSSSRISSSSSIGGSS
jgi:hypothetical protein